MNGCVSITEPAFKTMMENLKHLKVINLENDVTNSEYMLLTESTFINHRLLRISRKKSVVKNKGKKWLKIHFFLSLFVFLKIFFQL